MGQLRKIRYRLFAWRRFPELEASKEAIDVVIPIIRKDLQILPLCLEGVRRCVAHPIAAIYIVAPAEKEIIQFCETNDLIFVDEQTIFGFGPKDLRLEIHTPDAHPLDRSGWLFQQFLKLSGRVGTCRYYLCIDADHVLIRPHVFLTNNGETVFYMSYEEHQPYYENIHRLIPGLPLDRLSYVDHKMLFDKTQLQALHQQLVHTPHSSVQWTEAILQSYDRSCHAGFSEFELYGNFVEKKVQRPWLQKRLSYQRLKDYESLRKEWSRSRWSLTFPDYMNP